MSSELPERDGAPVRVRLLGENLIACPDLSSGKIGLIQKPLPAPRRSLFFGRSEEEGLRCVYHGWKYDCEGACVDMPSEPAESKLQVEGAGDRCIRASSGTTSSDLHGTAPDAAALPDIEPNMLPPQRVRRAEGAPRVQLVPGARGRHRHEPPRVPPPRRGQAAQTTRAPSTTTTWPTAPRK